LLPDTQFDLSVCDATLAQFESLAKQTGRNLEDVDTSVVNDWAALVPRLMISLVEFFKVGVTDVGHNEKILTLSQALPASIGICLEILYPSKSARERLHLSRRLDLNQVVDSVLKTIYQTSMSVDTRIPRRRIIFTSFSPDVCAALNWKQPNCTSSSPPNSRSR